MSIEVVVLFFFKQKTAYEMRISDWSSDVCSSDLRRDPADDDVHPGGIGVDGIGLHQLGIADHAVQEEGVERQAVILRQPGIDGVELRAIILAQIGRASCRERVCQYV